MLFDPQVKILGSETPGHGKRSMLMEAYLQTYRERAYLTCVT